MEFLLKAKRLKLQEKANEVLSFFFFLKAAFVCCTAGAGTELLAKANELLAKS